jgi:hypothetical protein
MRTALKKWRRTTIYVIGLIIAILGPIISLNYNRNINFYYSPVFTLITISLIVILPLIILVADIIKGKVAENEENI